MCKLENRIKMQFHSFTIHHKCRDEWEKWNANEVNDGVNFDLENLVVE